MSPLISAHELATLLRADEPVHVLDVRWRLDAPEGRPAYLDGHIPRAVYADLERDLAHRADPRQGRHPLPTDEILQAAVTRWGIRDGATVVVYDDVLSVAASRAWWVLRSAGINDVRVLDGGLRAWLAEGLPLHTGDVQPRPGNAVVALRDRGISGDEAGAWQGVLIDARAMGRYRGGDDPNDPIGGHIPGAVNLPTTVHVQAGFFRSPHELARLFAAVGADGSVPVAAYCGSGVAAAHTVLAGAIAGIDVRLYAGSWSEWSRTPGRPIATGT